MMPILLLPTFLDASAYMFYILHVLTLMCSFNSQRTSSTLRPVRTPDIQRKIRFHMLFLKGTYGAIVFPSKEYVTLR